MENLQKLSYSLSWCPGAFRTIFLALHGCQLGPSQLHNDVKCSMGLNNSSMFLNRGITLVLMHPLLRHAAGPWEECMAAVLQRAGLRSNDRTAETDVPEAAHMFG